MQHTNSKGQPWEINFCNSVYEGFDFQPFQHLLYLDRKDSRQDGTRNSNGPTILDKLEEGFGPEEELCDDKICSGVHLFLQVFQVHLITLCFRVTRGVSFAIQKF